MSPPKGPSAAKVPRPPVIGRDADNGQEVRYPCRHHGSPGNYPSASVVLLGNTGSGKTYLAKLRLLREARHRTPATIIDSSGTYTQLVQQLGGRVIRPDLPGQGLNPFYLVLPQDPDEETLRQGTLPRIALLEILINAITSAAVNDDSTWLTESTTATIASFYRQHNVWGAINQGSGGLNHYRQHLLETKDHGILPFRIRPNESLAARIEKRNLAMAQVIGRFLNSPVARLAADNTDLAHKGITTVDLNRLPEEEQSIAMAMAMVLASTTPAQRPARRLLIIDDCAPLMRHRKLRWMLPALVRSTNSQNTAVMAISRRTGPFFNPDRPEGHSGFKTMQNCAAALLTRQNTHDLEHLPIAFLADDTLLPRLAAIRPGTLVHVDRLGKHRTLTVRPGPKEQLILP